MSNDLLQHQNTIFQNHYPKANNEVYESEDFVNGERRAVTGGNNKHVRNNNIGGGNRSARSGSESSTNIRKPVSNKFNIF